MDVPTMLLEPRCGDSTEDIGRGRLDPSLIDIADPSSNTQARSALSVCTNNRDSITTR